MDAFTARHLDAELQQYIANGQTRLIVDFEQTRYISSHGLRVLLAAHKQAQENGGALKLCGLNARLMEIFEMAGFDRVLDIVPTREQAEKSFDDVSPSV